jgi:hypothetical protein
MGKNLVWHSFSGENFHATSECQPFANYHANMCLQSLAVSSNKIENSYKSQLIFAGHCDVSNPGKCLVTTLFNYLQIPNLHNIEDSKPFRLETLGKIP